MLDTATLVGCSISCPRKKKKMITKEMILDTSTLDDFNNLVRRFKCQECPLREEAWVRGDHIYPVPNDYNIEFHSPWNETDIVFVGEALGEQEALSGFTFSGKAGELIRGAIESVIEELDYRVNYLFLNICMCRPQGNRTPKAEEATSCLPFLQKQLLIIKPTVIVTLGAIATKYILGLTNTPTMKEWAGKQVDIEVNYRAAKIPVLATYHPSYLCRQMDSTSIIPEQLESNYTNTLKKAIGLVRRYKGN